MKSTIQQIENKKSQIEKLQSDIIELQKDLEREENKQELVKIKLSTGIIEVEEKLHLEMTNRDKIIIPEGYRLLTFSEFMEIWNEHKELLDYGNELPDEVVQHPIKDNDFPCWNVWFHWLVGGRSGLGCDGRDLHGGNGRVRGVRFCRSLK